MQCHGGAGDYTKIVALEPHDTFHLKLINVNKPLLICRYALPRSAMSKDVCEVDFACPDAAVTAA